MVSFPRGGLVTESRVPPVDALRFGPSLWSGREAALLPNSGTLMAYTLDTAAATERMVAAGVDPATARAIVAEVARADDAHQAGLATKADLLALEVRLVKWGIGIALAVGGLLFALLRLTG